MDSTLALIAHDGKKPDLLAFAMFNRLTLSSYRLIANQTAGLLEAKVGLVIDCLHSGPAGGDAQVAAVGHQCGLSHGHAQ